MGMRSVSELTTHPAEMQNKDKLGDHLTDVILRVLSASFEGF